MKKNKKQKQIKTYTVEKFNKLLKICLGSYIMVSLVSAFLSNWVLTLLTILTLVLTAIVIRRKPPQELPKVLEYQSENMIDISALPYDYKKKMQSIFVVLYQDAEKNNRLELPSEVSESEEK